MLRLEIKSAYLKFINNAERLNRRDPQKTFGPLSSIRKDQLEFLEG